MKSIKIKSFIGAGPGDQEASYWTKGDWDKHNARIEELKANGTYGMPTETEFHLQSYPEFDDPISKPIEYGILIPKGNGIDPDNLPEFGLKYNKS